MRTREKLANFLTVEIGRAVDPDKLWPQTGAWRTDFRLGVCRWEASLPAGFDGASTSAMSWYTMTDLLRHGVRVEWDGPTIDVSALNHEQGDQRAAFEWQRKAARCLRRGENIPPSPHITFGQMQRRSDDAARASCNAA